MSVRGELRASAFAVTLRQLYRVVPVEDAVDEPFHAAPDRQDQQGDDAGQEGRRPLPRAAGDAEGRDEPDRRGGGQTVHHLVVALQNRAAAEEADAGDDALNDAADRGEVI